MPSVAGKRDALVVESVNFNEETRLTDDGAFLTTGLRVVERLTRNGDTMERQATAVRSCRARGTVETTPAQDGEDGEGTARAGARVEQDLSACDRWDASR